MVRFIKQAIDLDTRLFLKAFTGMKERRTWRKVFFAVSRCADGPLYFIGALISLFLFPGKAEPYVEAAAAAFVLEITLYTVLKKGIKRPRPYRKVPGTRNWIGVPDEFSFPSGHTAGAFLMALIIATAVPLLAPAAYMVACLVGFSRVALGVHYPGDVLAGMFLGSACAGLALILI